MSTKIYCLFLMASIFSMETLANKSAPWVGASLEGVGCSGGIQAFGPFDYTLRGGDNAKNLNLVEIAHFTPEVENLVAGKNATTPEIDLNYTLRAWPNHHRALLSMVQYQLNIDSKVMHDKLKTSPECYLQRAINFSPNDAVPYSLYGYYLRKKGHIEDSVKFYDKAMALDPDNVKIAYSYSLVLIDLKRYDDALKYAKVAYSDRRAPKGLKQKLEKLGVWKN